MISWSFATTSSLTSYLRQAWSHVCLRVFEIPHRPYELVITLWSFGLLTTIIWPSSQINLSLFRILQVCHGVTNTGYRGFLALIMSTSRVLLQNECVIKCVPLLITGELSEFLLWASGRVGHLFYVMIIRRPISKHTHVYFCKFRCISQSFWFYKVGETVFKEIVRKILLKYVRSLICFPGCLVFV